MCKGFGKWKVGVVGACYHQDMMHDAAAIPDSTLYCRVTFWQGGLGLGMTTTPKTPSWFDISVDAWALAAESNMVIAMRIGSMVQGGPDAAREAERMVSEKVAANIALGCDLISGKLGSSPEAIVSGSIAHYSKRVVANRKRLSK